MAVMKVTIDVAPLTQGYLERLVARGELESIESAVDYCFVGGAVRLHEIDVANGIEADAE